MAFGLRTCTVHLERREVERNGHVLALTPSEVALIRFLLKRTGEVVERRVIEREVWGFRAGVRSRAVAACVQRLRSKIVAQRAAWPDKVNLVRGV